jgi:hypothetical protein
MSTERQSRAALIIATLALVVAVLGVGGPPAAQAIKRGLNADKVDGFHAVKAGAKARKRAGKLVATDKYGRVPDAALLQGQPAGRFVTKGSKATDSDLLDGLDSSEFLAAGGKAVAAGQADLASNAGALGGLGPGRYLTQPGGLKLVAAGAVNLAGQLSRSTGGITVTKAGVGLYDINFGESYAWNTYVTNLTLVNPSKGMISAAAAVPKLRVMTFSATGTAADSYFQFMIFKLP